MRKDIYEIMKMLKQEGVKVNYSKIADQYDGDYRTVKRYFCGVPKEIILTT